MHCLCLFLNASIDPDKGRHPLGSCSPPASGRNTLICDRSSGNLPLWTVHANCIAHRVTFYNCLLPLSTKIPGLVPPGCSRCTWSNIPCPGWTACYCSVHGSVGTWAVSIPALLFPSFTQPLIQCFASHCHGQFQVESTGDEFLLFLPGRCRSGRMSRCPGGSGGLGVIPTVSGGGRQPGSEPIPKQSLNFCSRSGGGGGLGTLPDLRATVSPSHCLAAVLFPFLPGLPQGDKRTFVPGSGKDGCFPGPCPEWLASLGPWAVRREGR